FLTREWTKITVLPRNLGGSRKLRQGWTKTKIKNGSDTANAQHQRFMPFCASSEARGMGYKSDTTQKVDKSTLDFDKKSSCVRKS
ncbi:MAG: hypothetical protein QM296_13835, partial [Bacillota bacterium]|nr:hypothetical protein [Bacillota bacterium]